MCLRPITIRTNRYNYRQGIDKMFMQVPCGDCEECRLMRINDYYVRLHYEWERYMKNGGSVFFITLSHNNLSLPFTPEFQSLDNQVINDFLSTKGLYVSEEMCGIPCFDKSAVRSFLERIHHLDRFPESILRGIRYHSKNEHGQFTVQKSCFCTDFGELRNPVLGSDIKHFVVCEYGKTTKRPHYHALIFFPFIVQAGAFKRLCEFAWSSLYKSDDVPLQIRDIARYNFDVKNKDYLELRDWFIYRTGKQRKKTYYMHKNGFVMYSVKGAQMTRPTGMKYLCKYLFKDTEFLKIPYVPEFIELVKELPALDSFKESEIKRCLRRYKDCLPFFLISNNVGTLFEDDVKCETLEDAQKFAKRNFMFENDSNIYAMPKYFIRRLLYDNKHFVKIDDDYKHVTICYLTEFGKNVLKSKFDDSVARFVDKVRLVSTSSFKSLFYPLDFETGKVGCDVPFSLSQFYEDLYHNFLSIPKLRLLAYYKLVFKDVVTNLPVDCDYSYNDYINLGNEIFSNKIDTHNDNHHTIYNNKYILLHEVKPDFSAVTFNQLDVFAGFDSFLYRLEFVYNLIHDRNYKESANRHELEMRYRSLYNSIIYKNAL